MKQGNAFVVVGVAPRGLAGVLTTAAGFAEHFGAELVCVSVDASRYTVRHEPDGRVVSMPIDSDLADEGVEEFNPELRAAIARALDRQSVSWSVRALAGGPAQEIARLADELDAAMIVVGTRDPGIRGSLHEFFNGSVAVQLAHRQHRPVVVVPLHAVSAGGELPWQVEE
ncbi:universal stress protein [Kocuria sp. cx-455]|uniref:universal stress protein n=1 Tax=Kocuria sp. cx-455 TaxID=2771377 RepID=UPI00168539E2|nr:universal stress protein [Kocuria sp. cx-455]MBD2764432.1 universal stress protein [Kocuria sp. cx-455]